MHFHLPSYEKSIYKSLYLKVILYIVSPFLQVLPHGKVRSLNNVPFSYRKFYSCQVREADGKRCSLVRQLLLQSSLASPPIVSSHVFQSGQVKIASPVLHVQNLDVREVDAYNFSSRLIQPTSFSMVPAARLPLVEQTPVVWCPARRRGRALPRQLLSSSCYRGVTQLNRRSSKSPFV